MEKLEFTDHCLDCLKRTLSPKSIFSYMKDITFLNIIHNEKISYSPPLQLKIADLLENVRLERPKKQAIVTCGGPEKQAIKCPVVGKINRQ